jgi:hypothetical protein
VTDLIKPGAGAVVTREHRLQSAHILGYRETEDWVGAMVEGTRPCQGTFLSVAQAIAEAELRGQRSRDAEVERLSQALAKREVEAGEMFYEITDLKSQLACWRRQPTIDAALEAVMALYLSRNDISWESIEADLKSITAALARGGK